MKNKQTDHIPDISKMVSTEDVSTEFVEIVNKNFWEMIDMKNKQTESVAEGGKTMSSIDWLTNKLFEEFGFAFSNNILQQAKEMHKQEIMDAVEFGFSEGCSFISNCKTKLDGSEEYYNLTFNPQNND